jgi:putative heme-binding domain-containing protein
VDGVYRGPVERDRAPAQAAVTPLAEALLADASAPVRGATAGALSRLEIRAAEPLLRTRAREDRAPEVRIAALKALHGMGAGEMEAVVRGALADPDGSVRMAALALTPTLGLPEATTVALLDPVFEGGSVEEQQSAVAVLGQLSGPEARGALLRLVDRLAAGELPSEVELDLREAVEASGAPALRTRLEAYRAGRAGGGPVAAFAEALRGGRAAAGEQVFYGHAAAQCTRCHSLGIEGATVGPNLSRIGAALSREALLEALVDPSARIAPGYGSVSVTLRDGEVLSGLLREESAGHLVVQTSGGEARRLAAADVAQRTNAPSAMPPMGELLTRREIRDLVEFLTTLK